MGWAGGKGTHQQTLQGYIYAYPFIIGKKVISVSASICWVLDSYPSVYPFCIWYRVSCISQLLHVLTVIAIRKLCWSLTWFVLFVFLPIALAFNFPWNKFSSGGKRGVCRGTKKKKRTCKKKDTANCGEAWKVRPSETRWENVLHYLHFYCS